MKERKEGRKKGRERKKGRDRNREKGRSHLLICEVLYGQSSDRMLISTSGCRYWREMKCSKML